MISKNALSSFGYRGYEASSVARALKDKNGDFFHGHLMV